jgi:hypothetical protein
MGDLKTCGLLHKAYSQKEWAFLFPKRSERSRIIPAIASLKDLRAAQKDLLEVKDLNELKTEVRLNELIRKNLPTLEVKE